MRAKCTGRGKPRVIIVIVFLLCVGVCQAAEMQFRQYTVGEGLIQSRVRAIAQDEIGRMWFGTVSGLSVYDGVNFQNTPLEKLGLPSSDIYAIHHDLKHRMWVGTSRAGCLVFSSDGQLEFTLDTRAGLKSNRVNTIVEDLQGNIWLGTGNGLVLADPHSVIVYGTESGLLDPRVNAIVQGKDGVFYLGTPSGLYVRRAGSFDRLEGPDEQGRNFVQCLTMSLDGILYAGTRDGLLIYDRGEFRHRRFSNQSLNFIEDLFFDGAGQLWMATGRGLISLRGDRAQVFRMGSYHCEALYEDREGILWVGTRGGGVLKVSSRAFIWFTIGDGLLNQEVLAVSKVSGGRIVAGTNNGAYVLEPEADSWFRQLENLPSRNITAIAPVGDAVWLGTWKGVAVQDGIRTTVYGESDGLPHPRVECLAAAEEGSVLVGTFNGVVRWDGHKFVEDPRLVALADKDVTVISRGGADDWYFVANGGLWRMAENHLIQLPLPRQMSDVQVSCLTKRPDGGLWVGTSRGILVYRDGWRETPGALAGLPDPFVVALAATWDGVLWVGTNRGVARFNGKTLYVYNARNGFKGEELITPNSLFVDDDNRVWFGTFAGLCVYDASEDESRAVPPVVYIQQVKVDDKEMTPAGPISLPYRRNQLEIVFRGVSFRDESDVRFSYRLQDLAEQWSPLHREPRVTFYSLPAGEYRFQVKALNGDGIWSRGEAVLSFSVATPFWLKWWFIFGGVVVLGVGAAGTYRYRVHLLKRRTVELEKVVVSRTEELVQMNRELAEIGARDDLTGVLNRRAFAQEIDRAIRQAQLDQSPFCCLMLDLDNFKKVNDEYGHLLGDQVLITVADLLRTSVRRHDLICRYGGDEFVILLFDVEEELVLQIGQKIVDLLNDHFRHFQGKALDLTASVGIGLFHHRQDHLSRDYVFSRIDAALYQAKSLGKNRIYFVDEDPKTG